MSREKRSFQTNSKTEKLCRNIYHYIISNQQQRTTYCCQHQEKVIYLTETTLSSLTTFADAYFAALAPSQPETLDFSFLLHQTGGILLYSFPFQAQ